MSNPDLLRMPPLPTWDPDSKVNPFDFIVKAAPMVRAQRQVIVDEAMAIARARRRRDCVPVPLKP